MIRTYITATILTVIMIAAVVYGIFESGSPFEIRNKKFDQQRVSDLSNLTYSVEDYYKSKGVLPEKLSDIKSSTYSSYNTKDPESKKDYEYQASGSNAYKICADFSTDTSKANSSESLNTIASYDPYNQKYAHPKGHYCFEFDTQGQVQNQISTTSPTSTNTEVKNPYSSDISEMARRQRDAARLADLANMQQAINVAVQEATQSSVLVLCAGDPDKKFPCSGSSMTDVQPSDGSGWIKMQLAQQRAVSVPVLPLDPVNDGVLHYVYCADKDGWEINAVLESSQQSPKMQNDGGDDNTKYEVGSNLNLINKSSSCNY
jgi:hypothetical protein